MLWRLPKDGINALRVIQGLDNEASTFERSVLTVGNFDGVHRGHRRIVAVARQRAEQTGCPVVALTFEPHPLSVVTPAIAPERLTLPARKLAYLEDAGVDVAVVAESTPDLLSLTAETFVRDVLVERFHPSDIVEGQNFGFGRGRAGDIETLRREGAKHGFAVQVVDPVQAANPDGKTQRVSSSFVRALLADGHVELAADALTNPFALDGTVVRGAGRGRSLGFPTANVSVSAQLIPADGVYEGRVEVAGGTHTAAVSIGTTPTFDGTLNQVEAHLLDFDADIYEQPITVHFVRRLRSQEKFDSRDALIEQIERDLEELRGQRP